METANYSLNNDKKYIIKTYDKFNQRDNTEQKYNNTEQKYNNTRQRYKNTHLFDKHCIELYGNKTCILFHIDSFNIEVRLLDHIRYNKNYPVRYINKNSLYNEIPNLIKNNYTVIIVEHILNTNTTEITSIHLPPK